MIRTFGSMTGITNQPQGLDVGIGSISPWLNDWSACTTKYDWSRTGINTAATSWNTFVNETGEGWLYFARTFSGAAAAEMPDMRITIDGIPYTFEGITNSSGGFFGNEASQPIYFKNSLKIEAYNRTTSAQTLYCDYTYLLKNGTPNPNKQTLMNSSARQMRYLTTTSTALVDIVNVTGSGYLLSAEFLGYYQTTTQVTLGNIIIDGVTKLNDRQMSSFIGIDYKQPVVRGPIRFTSSLRVQIRIGGTGSTAIGKAFYTLD